MGWLDRNALDRWQRKLAGSLGPDETLLDFDSGAETAGGKVTCFATQRTLFVLRQRGEVLRLPYEDFAGLYVSPTHVAVDTGAGRRFEFRFRSPRGGFAEQLREHASRVLRERAARLRSEGRLFEVDFGSGKGARFTVGDDGALGATTIGGLTDDLPDTMLLEQAWGELEVALGRPASLQYADPRPSWMPTFAWSPTLPGAAHTDA